MVVGGDSASGNFAAACCLLAKERNGPKPIGQILLYAVTNIFASSQDPDPDNALFQMIARLYFKNKKQISHPHCSPALAEDLSVMPPTLVVTAEFCPFMNDGETFAQKLSDADVQVKAIRYNGVNHAFLDKVGVWKYADGCIEDIADYLKTEIQLSENKVKY